MSENLILNVHSTEIEVVRKDIKNLHLSVYPPKGRVRISAPLGYDNETIRLFAISKWGWIKDNIKIIQNQTRIPPKEYISGESHYLFGKRYMLKIALAKQNSVHIKGVKYIEILLKETASLESKKKLMQCWYKECLKEKLSVLIPIWEAKTGLKINSWQIRKMKTRWGSCNTDKKSICLNLELAKRSVKEIEYVILHELSHLVEKTHNKKFVSHLDKFMPNWQIYRKELNSVTFED